VPLEEVSTSEVWVDLACLAKATEGDERKRLIELTASEGFSQRTE